MEIQYDRIRTLFYKRKLRFLHNTPVVSNNSKVIETGIIDNYDPVILNQETLKRYIFDVNIIEETIEYLQCLSPDKYTDFTIKYYEAGLKNFGRNWCYADIVTVLFCISKLIKPNNYLEIGVRKGRSLAAVAVPSPNCSLFGFDMWVENYAGMNNEGEDYVKNELLKIGHKGSCKLINGDSHKIINTFFAENPNLFFELITVDGDHTFYGAAQDLIDTLPRLAIGGILVFDDIVNPRCAYLNDVWNIIVKSNKRFSTFEFTELGYGVAIAIRLY